MSTAATMISRSPIAWDGDRVGFVAAILSDGRGVRVVGEGRSAHALYLRAREVLEPGPDPARVLFQVMRRSISSYESASPPRFFDASLDEAAAQLSQELGLPVLAASTVPAAR
jgi:hypothetical protein